ncbi:hypothetical protein B0H19DRAFT_1148141 [Mycena capillaripes]|nr:hypothetical protein B0H19DRAFT_1148141 [Mycena capillaripes]
MRRLSSAAISYESVSYSSSSMINSARGTAAARAFSLPLVLSWSLGLATALACAFPVSLVLSATLGSAAASTIVFLFLVFFAGVGGPEPKGTFFGLGWRCAARTRCASRTASQ